MFNLCALRPSLGGPLFNSPTGCAMVASIGPVKTTDHYTEALQPANQTSHLQGVSGRPERPHCVLSIRS